jgi:hypothetical protein
MFFSDILTLSKIRLIQDSRLFWVRLRQVSLYYKNYWLHDVFSDILTLFKAWLIPDSGLFRVGFRQVSLYSQTFLCGHLY